MCDFTRDSAHESHSQTVQCKCATCELDKIQDRNSVSYWIAEKGVRGQNSNENHARHCGQNSAGAFTVTFQIIGERVDMLVIHTVATIGCGSGMKFQT